MRHDGLHCRNLAVEAGVGSCAASSVASAKVEVGMTVGLDMIVEGERSRANWGVVGMMIAALH